MAKATVIKGRWWWCGVEQCVGDVVNASDVQVARWADDGLVEPIEAAEETATAPEHETAVRPRKRR